MYCPACGKQGLDKYACPACGFTLMEYVQRLGPGGISDADIALRLGEYEEAYGLYSRELERDSGRAGAWVGKGIAAANLTDFDDDRPAEAVACFREAFRASGGDLSSGKALSAQLHALAMSLIGRAFKSMKDRSGARDEKERVYDRFVQKTIAMNLAAHEMDPHNAAVIEDVVKLCEYCMGRHAKEAFDAAEYTAGPEGAGPYYAWLGGNDYARIRDYFAGLAGRSIPEDAAGGVPEGPTAGSKVTAGLSHAVRVAWRAFVSENLAILALVAFAAAFVAVVLFAEENSAGRYDEYRDMAAVTHQEGSGGKKKYADVTGFNWKSVKVGMSVDEAMIANPQLSFSMIEAHRPERVYLAEDGGFVALAGPGGRIFSVRDLLHVEGAFGRNREIIQEFRRHYGEPDFLILNETGDGHTGYYYYRWGDPSVRYCEVIIQGDTIKLSIVDSEEDSRNSYP